MHSLAEFEDHLEDFCAVCMKNLRVISAFFFRITEK